MRIERDGWAELRDPTWLERVLPQNLASGGAPAINDPDVCLHCRTHQCVGGCPTGCYRNRPDNRVDLDTARCIGCLACVVVCDELLNIRWESGA